MIHFWIWPAFDQPPKGFNWNTACGLRGTQVLHSAYWHKVTCPECLIHEPA